MSTCKAYQETSEDTQKYIPQIKMVLMKILSEPNAKTTYTQLSYPKAIMQKYWEGIHQ